MIMGERVNDSCSLTKLFKEIRLFYIMEKPQMRYLVVSIHLNNNSQKWIISPGVKIKKCLSCHHPEHTSAVCSMDVFLS